MSQISTVTAPQQPLVQSLLNHKAFLVASAILLVSAVGFNATVAALKLHFKKFPVPSREAMSALPTIVGNRWVQLSKDQPLDPEIQQALQTDQYIFRDYVDARKLGTTPKALLAECEKMDWTDREKKLTEIKRQNPEAVVTLGLTYYTGKADTVAHIPERCYLADGYNIVEQGDVAAGPDKPTEPDLRQVTFESEAGTPTGVRRCNVAYVFHCNGGWSTSSNTVRLRLQDLRVKYGYYAKVEMMSNVSDRSQAGDVMRDFFEAASADVGRILPDFDSYAKK